MTRLQLIINGETMKNILIVLAILASHAFSQGTQLKLYDYQLSVNSLVKTKSGKIGFAVLKPVKNAKDDNTFGYWLSNNTNSSFVFLEIKEGNKTIVSVTAKDFSAKAKAQGGSLTYKAGTGADAVDITLESSLENNEMMPLSKSVAVRVKVKAQGNKNLSAVLNLYADGYVTKVGATGITNSRVEKGKAEYPVLLVAGNEGTSVQIEGEAQKSPGKIVKLSSNSVQSSGAEVSVMSFRVNGSTVNDYTKSVQQAANIESSISSKKGKTEIALVNVADKQKPQPGDTVTFTIHYTNVGTAYAQNAEISNPIPEDMLYVEGSAKGESAEVTEVRKQAAAPQQGEVESIRWKIIKRIMPGEEGIVTMKAIVK